MKETGSKKRTVIEPNVDGSITIRREALLGVPGTSRQRRRLKRQAVEPEWHVIDRVVAISSDKTPTKAKKWAGMEFVQPIGMDIDSIGNVNEILTMKYIMRAQDIVAAIQNAQKTAPWPLTTGAAA